MDIRDGTLAASFVRIQKTRMHVVAQNKMDATTIDSRGIEDGRELSYLGRCSALRWRVRGEGRGNLVVVLVVGHRRICAHARLLLVHRLGANGERYEYTLIQIVTAT